MRDSNQLWDKSIQLLLVMIVGFNLIPHTLYLPPWVTAVTGSALIWKTLILLRGYQKPQRWLVLSITVAGTIGILLSYHTIIGQEPASALLVMLASLKLLETNRYRDAMLVTFVSYFLLMAHLLNSQSLLSTMYMALDVLLITTLMFHLHKRDRRTSARSFRPVMKMLAATLPVWVFLFIAFPRFSTGLWHLEHPAAQGTGFSDSLSPGSVDKLIDSDELAFRVDFDRSSNPRLNPESLYWRGAILTESHGLEWRKLTISPTASGQKGAEKDPLKDVVEVPDLAAREAFSYQIFLEPIFHEWLFALDFPRDVTMNDPVLQKYARTQPGFTFGLNQPITSRFVYTGHSTLVSPPLILQDRQAYLQIPLEMSPRVVELARTLKAGTHNSEEASRHILKYFDDKNFRYTHTPGRIPAGQDQLDFFLFTSRRGFCEHFAGAYSSLMRLMGYPARVVIGFQGGRMNEFGKYMSVRSLDAHAWSEIWREDSRRQNHGRWIRVDPTETIAPMRLLLGGDYNRLDAAQLAQGLTKEELRDHLEGGWLHFNLKAAMAWDAMQMK
jgi:transglutaminase-like putative cysteine protease